jgi:hypothetical protein
MVNGCMAVCQSQVRLAGDWRHRGESRRAVGQLGADWYLGCLHKILLGVRLPWAITSSHRPFRPFISWIVAMRHGALPGMPTRGDRRDDAITSCRKPFEQDTLSFFRAPSRTGGDTVT